MAILIEATFTKVLPPKIAPKDLHEAMNERRLLVDVYDLGHDRRFCICTSFLAGFEG